MDGTSQGSYSQYYQHYLAHDSQNQKGQFENNISNYYDQYTSFFIDIELQVQQIIDNKLKDIQQLAKHKITLVNQSLNNSNLVSLTKPQTYILGQLYNGAIFKYQIVVGKYKFSLNLLNVKQNCSSKLLELGKGAYGKVCRIQLHDKTIVTKQIKFKRTVQIFEKRNDQYDWSIYANKMQIQDCLHEYCIYKLCSFFEIGPRVFIDFQFDVLCFNDAIEFYLEQCKELNFNHKDFKKQLKVGLRLLHSLNIIHKDIKPSNFLYSYEYEKIVFSDFGISHTVEEPIGYNSMTYKQGTYKYMSIDMQTIPFGEQKYIDLYYNDYFGLKISLEEIERLPEVFDFNNIPYKSKKLNIFYFKLYLWSLLCNNKIKQLNELTKKYNLVKDIKQFEQLKQQDIKRTILLNLSKVSKQDIDIQCMIRCYGMTYQLAQQLKQYKQKGFIKKIKWKLKNKNILFNGLQQISKLQTLTYQRKRQKALENQFKNESYATLLQEQKIKVVYQLFKLKVQFNYQNAQENILMNEVKIINKNCQQLEIMQVMKKIKHGIDCAIQIQQLLQKRLSLQSSEVILKIAAQFYYRKEQWIDSIKYFDRLISIHEANKYKIQETLVFYMMIGICYRYMNLHEKSFQYLQIAISRAQKFGCSATIKSFILKQIGLYYCILQQYSKSLQIIHHSLKLFIQTLGENHLYVLQCQALISTIYIMIGEYPLALNYAKKCQQKLKLVSISKYIMFMQIYTNIGMCYLMAEQFSKSLQNFKTALNISEYHFNSQILTKVKIYLNMAKCYQKIQQFQYAYQYIQLSMKLIKQSKNPSVGFLEVECINSLGEYYNKKNQFKQAINYFHEALTMKSDNKISHISANIYGNIAQSYLGLNKPVEAIQYDKKAILIREKIYGQTGIKTIESYYHLAMNYITIDYNLSIFYFSKAETQLFQKNTYFLIKILYQRAKCHIYYNDHKEAKECLLKILQYQKQIINTKIFTQIIYDAVICCRVIGNARDILSVLKSFIFKQFQIQKKNKIQLLMQISICHSIHRESVNSLYYLEQGFKILNIFKQTLKNQDIMRANYMYCLANKYFEINDNYKSIYFYKKLEQQFYQATDKLKNLYKRLSVCSLKIKKYERAQYYKNKEILVKQHVYRTDYKQMLLIVKFRKNSSQIMDKYYKKKFGSKKVRNNLDIINNKEDIEAISKQKINQYFDRKYKNWLK